jgi:hypothetical protein
MYARLVCLVCTMRAGSSAWPHGRMGAWPMGAPFSPSTTTAAAEPNAPHAATGQGTAAIEGPADYEAIASASPFLTQLCLELPANATAVPQEMDGVLSACNKLEDLEIGHLKRRE